MKNGFNLNPVMRFQRSVLALGKWKTARPFGAVKSALEMGYQHIDCARIYQNEADVGRGLRESFAGGIERDNVWVTSKLWNDSHRPEHVRPALEQSLTDLHLNHLDLYLIHWPVAIKNGLFFPDEGSDFIPIEKIPLGDTWHAMERCVEAGLVKNIGVCNFNQRRLQDLIDNAVIAPAVNQVEGHPLLPQSELFEFCNANDIAYTAYSPLGSGDRPDRMKSEDDPNLFENELFKDIAAAQSLSVGQLLLAWATTRGTVTIPKSANVSRQAENLAAGEIELPADVMSAIANVGLDHRYVHGKFFELPGSPYVASELWD